MNSPTLLMAVLIASSAGVASAKAMKEPNCEVNGKKMHVKDEKACTKKKGTWTSASGAMAPAASDKMAPAAGGAMAPAEADPKAAPAEGAMSK